MVIELLQPFAISLLIGLAVGIDRERRVPDGQGTMGIRTFAVTALLGTVASRINNPALTGGLTVLLALVISIGYLRATSLEIPVLTTGQQKDVDGPTSKSQLGLTTEISAALVFALGYLAIEQRVLAGILGIVLVTTLYSRRYLHFFSREFLRPKDIGAALTLAICAFIIMPSLPETPVDPWGLLVPRRIMQIMLLIGGTEFFGYLIQRILGPGIGSLATGFLGGLVSSTAVFLSVARKTHTGNVSIPAALGTGLAANMATMFLFVAVVATTSRPLMLAAGVPVLAVALTSGAIAHLALRKNGQRSTPTAEQQSPLDVRHVLGLSVFIVGLLALTAIVRRSIGTEAFTAVSFVSGLFELQATTFAAAMLHHTGEINADTATTALLVTAIASHVSKLAICWSLGSPRFAAVASASLLLSAAAGSTVWAILNFLPW